MKPYYRSFLTAYLFMDTFCFGQCSKPDGIFVLPDNSLSVVIMKIGLDTMAEKWWCSHSLKINAVCLFVKHDLCGEKKSATVSKSSNIVIYFAFLLVVSPGWSKLLGRPG